MKGLSYIYSFFALMGEKISVFFKNKFDISVTKRSQITGLMLGFLTLLGVVFRAENFIVQEFPAKWLLLAFALICPFLIMLVTIFNIKIKNETFNKIWHFLFMFLMPIITLTRTECLNSIFI